MEFFEGSADDVLFQRSACKDGMRGSQVQAVGMTAEGTTTSPQIGSCRERETCLQHQAQHALPQGKVLTTASHSSIFADTRSHNCSDGAGLHHDVKHVPKKGGK